MGKGFLSGVLWGSVSGVAVLAVLSLYAPLSAERERDLTAPSAPDIEQSRATGTSGADTQEVDVAEGNTGSTAEIAVTDLAETVEPEPEMAVKEGEPLVTEEASDAPVIVTEAPEDSAEDTVAEEPVEEVVIVEVTPEPVEAPETVAAAQVDAAPDEDPDEQSGVQVVDAPEPQEDRPIGIVIYEPGSVAPEVQIDVPAGFAAVDENAPASQRVERVVEVQPAPAPTINAAPATELAEGIGETPVDPAIDPSAPNAIAQARVDAGSAPELSEEDPIQIAAAPSPQRVEAPTANPLPGDESSAAPLIEITQGTPNRSTLPSIEADTPEDEASAAPAQEEVPSSADQPITIGVPATPRVSDGVVTNRLPSLGGGTAVAPSSTPAAVQTGDALRSFAATPVSTEGANAVMSIILIDAGEKGMPVAQLNDLAFPFSVAIDPVAPGASERAAAFRSAGIEVLAMPADLPASASSSDVAVAMTSYFDALPESVAVLDTLDGKLQSNRTLLNSVLGTVKETGHGLVIYSRGLNTAQQAATRAEVENGAIFRVLDGEGESVATVKRTLDRAGFNAARDGSVILLGHSYEDTVKTLLEWSLDAKAATLTMVPVSQILIGETPAS
ncbi:MAG: divergent polysaccharide deacetylase family protein [Pseudomonadota bacterium]